MLQTIVQFQKQLPGYLILFHYSRATFIHTKIIILVDPKVKVSAEPLVQQRGCDAQPLQRHVDC